MAGPRCADSPSATRLGRIVAIKVLPADVAADPGRIRRFEHEARAISRLNHPHICALYDVGQHEGSTFLVMEHLEGESLAERLRKGALPLEEALRYATQIAEALDEAHQQGIIHRDLKPANVMLTRQGAKLLDFGIAKLHAGPASEDASTAMASETTREGVIVGTPQYMAPEQLEGKPVDARTDVFAFGVVLYEMVSGRKPFEATTRAGLIAAILRSEPAPLSRTRPQVPAGLDTLVRRCLAKDPQDRWPSCGELVAALGRARQAPSRRRRALVVAAGCLAVLAAAVALWPRHDHGPGPALTSEIPAKSIAVLPFQNLSPDPENAYFADGITEDVLTQLAKIGELKVIARTSVMRYKGGDKPVREIARELGVATVLEGSVRRSGNRVRITGQLIDARRSSISGPRPTTASWPISSRSRPRSRSRSPPRSRRASRPRTGRGSPSGPPEASRPMTSTCRAASSTAGTARTTTSRRSCCSRKRWASIRGSRSGGPASRMPILNGSFVSVSPGAGSTGVSRPAGRPSPSTPPWPKGTGPWEALSELRAG